MDTVWLKREIRELGFCGGSFELRSGAAGAGGTVALGELVHTTGGVDEALLTGEVRMAGGADTDTEVLHGGDRVIDGAAGAGDRRFEGLRMDVSFHDGVSHVTGRGAECCFRRGVGRGW